MENVNNIKSFAITFFQDSFKYIKNHKKETIISLILILTLILSMIGYSFYKESMQKAAHRDFIQALKVYQAKVVPSAENTTSFTDVFSSEEQKWIEVETTFKKAFEKNKGAGIAPFFLSYQVEALLNLGKLSEAINIQNQLIKMLPKNSKLRPYFQIKLALMKIDTNLEESINQGIDQLKQIAFNEENPSQDEALFRLGEYYWNLKQFTEAANYWNQFMIKFGKTAKQSSWRLSDIKSKLKTINS